MSLINTSDLPMDFRESLNKQSEKEMAREDFHTNRSGNFTASELHKLITPTFKIAQNDTAKNYVFEKAFEKATGQTARQEFRSQNTDWGNQYELQAIEDYKKTTGLEVLHTGDNQKFLKHPYLPVGANPDGMLESGHTLECKCPANGGEQLKNLLCGQDINKFKSMRFNYFIQTQVQIWLAGKDWGDFYTYRPNVPEYMTRYYLRIWRDDFTIKQIEEAVIKASSEIEDILRSVKL